MAMMRLKVICLCAALSAVSGCHKKENPAPEKGAGKSSGQGSLVVAAEKRLIEELAAEDTIVAVNGIAFKRKDYDATLRSIEEMYRVVNPNIRPDELTVHRQQRAASLVSEFITRQLLVQEAKKRGLKAAPESRAGLNGVLEKLAKKEGLPVAELSKSSNPTVKIVCDGIEDQALILTLRQAEFGDKLKVTDADLQAARERLVRYNEMCEQTNALVKARAAAIVERLRKGEDFTQVAKETSEYKGDTNGVWGTFSRAEIHDVLVRNAAFTLPVGAVSEPFDTQDGMAIIKVIERSGVDSPVAKALPSVTLGRILLLLGETQKIPDDKALRRELEQSRLIQLQRPWLADLQQKAILEFPHGTNLWKKAKNSRK